MVTRNSTTREDRAESLLHDGRVALYPGRAFADVIGSKGECYRVDRRGCTCPDYQRRGQDCKHVLAVRQLCRDYRAAQAEARATGRAHLPAHLARALVNATQRQRCQRCGVTTAGTLCRPCLVAAISLEDQL